MAFQQQWDSITNNVALESASDILGSNTIKLGVFNCILHGLGTSLSLVVVEQTEVVNIEQVILIKSNNLTWISRAYICTNSANTYSTIGNDDSLRLVDFDNGLAELLFESVNRSQVQSVPNIAY